MIVKNEEKSILETLKSAKNHCRQFIIFDTGSTDNTIEVVDHFCKENNTPLILEKIEFTDFSTTRNQLLDYCQQKTDAKFLVLLDAGDILNINDKYNLQLDEKVDAYFVKQDWLDITGLVSYYNVKIIRNNGKLIYQNPVHEFLTKKNDTDNVFFDNLGNITIFQDRIKYGGDSEQRYKKDEKILLELVEKDPSNKRNVYYLANTYYFMNDYENAKKYYNLRINLGGDDEEVNQSFVRYGKSEYFLKKNWDDIEPWFWKSWRYCNDIESLVIIAEQYYQNKDYKTSYHLLDLACSIDYKNRILWNNESVVHFLRWYLLGIVAFRIGNFETYKKCLDICNSSKLANIHRQKLEELVSLSQPQQIYRKFSDRNLIVIYGGEYYKNWDGNTTDLGGSETSIVNLSEELVKKEFEVVVFSNTTSETTINGVKYIPLVEYENFLKTYYIDTLIVQRYSDYLRYYYNIDNVILWLQDISFIGKGIENNDKLKHIVVLTEWHVNKFKELLGERDFEIIKSKLKVIGNAIDKKYYNSETKEIRDKFNKETIDFIYTSCPSRGLDMVIDKFNEISKIYPNCRLKLFCDFDNEYIIRNFSKKREEILTEIKKNKNIILSPRISKQQLAKEMKNSDIWLYLPYNFEETFCITALEIQASGVIPVFLDSGCLKEVIKSGICIKNCDDVIQILKTTILLKNNFNYDNNWTLQQTWDKRIKEWIEIL